MSALRKYKGLSKGGGLIQVEGLDCPEGEIVELVLLDEDSEDRLSHVTAAWAMSAFSKIWDDPEEDEAWKEL